MRFRLVSGDIVDRSISGSGTISRSPDKRRIKERKDERCSARSRTLLTTLSVSLSIYLGGWFWCLESYWRGSMFSQGDGWESYFGKLGVYSGMGTNILGGEKGGGELWGLDTDVVGDRMSVIKLLQRSRGMLLYMFITVIMGCWRLFSAKDAVAALIKRLAHRNANVQLYTLEVCQWSQGTRISANGFSLPMRWRRTVVRRFIGS